MYCLSETLRAGHACQKASGSIVLLLVSEISREVSVVEGQPSSSHFLKPMIPERTRQASTDLKHLSSVTDEYDIATPPSEQNLHAFFPSHREDVPSEGWSAFSHSIFQTRSHHWWSIRLDGQESVHRPTFSLHGSSR